MESHARVRLPVGMFIIGTGTVVYFIYPSPGGFYRFLHILVNRSQVMFCHQLFTYSPLVTHDDDFSKFVCQFLKCFFNTLIKPEFTPIENIIFFLFMIDHTIPVNK